MEADRLRDQKLKALPAWTVSTLINERHKLSCSSIIELPQCESWLCTMHARKVLCLEAG